MDILLIDAAGGPQADELAASLAGFGSIRTITVWNPGGPDRRIRALSALGPVSTVARPDHMIEAGLAVAAKHSIRAVASFSEDVSFYGGLLAHLLGLPGNPPAALLAVRHKDVQRALLAAAGVPSPRVRTVADEADLAFCKDLRFPVVLKPITGLTSFCVVRAGDPAELASEYAKARLRYESHPVSNGGRAVFLVEEEIHGVHWHADQRFGTQVSVESLIHNGAIHHIGVTDKTPLAPPFREEGHLTPTMLSSLDVARVEQVAADAIKAVGLTSGAVHTELMLTAGDPVILEVNGRIGGNVYGLMKYSRGYDVARAIMSIALAEAPELPGPAKRHAAFVRPQSPAGRFRVSDVVATSIDDAVRLTEWGIHDTTVGTELDSGVGSTSNLARYVVTADGSDVLFDKIEAVNQHIRDAVRLEPID